MYEEIKRQLNADIERLQKRRKTMAAISLSLSILAMILALASILIGLLT